MEKERNLNKAIDFAVYGHRHQLRKGTDIPYVAHPIGVAMLLQSVHCPEELVITGLLHDTVEDTAVTLEDIQTQFGDKIAAIVEGCSEPDKSLSWEDRKKHTLEYLKSASDDICMVAIADKLHNIQTIANDYARLGEPIWQRFKRGKAQQAWYYRSIAESLNKPNQHSGFLVLYQQYKDQVAVVFGQEW